MSYWVYVTSGPGLMTIRPELQVGTGNVSRWKFLLVAAGQCRSAGNSTVVARLSLLILALSLTSLRPHNYCILGEHDCNTKWFVK